MDDKLKKIALICHPEVRVIIKEKNRVENPVIKKYEVLRCLF